MNPWAFLVILLGIVLVIIGVKGTQHNITSAITGKAHAGSTVNVASAGNVPATTPSSGTPAPGQMPHQPIPNPIPNAPATPQ